jgi:hypothetical protein
MTPTWSDVGRAPVGEITALPMLAQTDAGLVTEVVQSSMKNKGRWRM